MSGWHQRDRKLESDMMDDFPAVNNITVRGYLPADQVPAPQRSRTLPEAHMKSLRLFRKWCRYMPFLISWTGYRKYANPEAAKLNLAEHWRQHSKARNVSEIDRFTKFGYERLYNIQMGDIWGGFILDSLAPLNNKGTTHGAEGYSVIDDENEKKRSTFLNNFYKGKNPNY